MRYVQYFCDLVGGYNHLYLITFGGTVVNIGKGDGYFTQSAAGTGSWVDGSIIDFCDANWGYRTNQVYEKVFGELGSGIRGYVGMFAQNDSLGDSRQNVGSTTSVMKLAVLIIGRT